MLVIQHKQLVFTFAQLPQLRSSTSLYPGNLLKAALKLKVLDFF